MNILLKPQLADNVDPSKLPELAADKRFFFEQKIDGQRLLVVIENGRVATLNRAGEPKSTMVTRTMEAQFECLEGNWAFDGEIVGETLWLFDLPIAGSEVGLAHSYEYRRQTLGHFYTNEWKPDEDAVRLLPCMTTETTKLELARKLLTDGAEGVMVKHRDAPYQSGRRSKNLLKAKFTKTADVIVTRVGVDGKDNVAVGLFDEDMKLREVGKSSTIGKGSFVPGDVIEVRYLYCVDPKEPRLYQPTILCKRDDKAAVECRFDQLMFTNKEVIDL